METRDDGNTLLLTALLLASAGWTDDPEILDRIYRRLRDRLYKREVLDPDLDLVFHELSRGAFRFGPSRRRAEARDIATDVIEGFRKGFEGSLNERFSKVDDELSELRNVQSGIKAEVSSIAGRTASVAVDLHSYLWATLAGIDFSKAQIVRYLPVRVFVGDPVPEEAVLDQLVSAVKELGNTLDLEPAEELPAQKGSWFKTWIEKTKRAFRHEEVQEALEKGRAALEKKYLDKPQAEETNLLADAAAKVITALSAIPGPCCGQAGSLLVIKLIDADGKPALVFKTLSAIELKRLEENASMLRQPGNILEWLESASVMPVAVEERTAEAGGASGTMKTSGPRREARALDQAAGASSATSPRRRRP